MWMERLSVLFYGVLASPSRKCPRNILLTNVDLPAILIVQCIEEQDVTHRTHVGELLDRAPCDNATADFAIIVVRKVDYAVPGGIFYGVGLCRVEFGLENQVFSTRTR